MKKLKIVGLSNQDTGVYFYRIKQPLNFIAKQKLARVHSLPFFGQHARHLLSQEFREWQALEGRWADVMFTTCASDRDYLALILAMRDRYKLKLVVDLDDDILSTPLEPNNPAYRTYMDKNARYAEYAQACLYEADLLTVSTDYLKKKYASVNKNIVVVKNCVDTSLFTPSTQEGVTIGYAGSGSHQGDWNMVESVLQRLKAKYGVKIKVLGPIYAPIADAREHWVDMLQYPQTLSDMQFSIGIAPLKDSMMNRAKSNLRWLEYSALKIPTVASDVVAFRGLKNVMLVKEPEEWEAALAKLIEDEAYRQQLGAAAYYELVQDYDPYNWAKTLYEAIQSIA